MTTSMSGGVGAEYFAQQYGVSVPQQQAQAPSQQQPPVHPPQQQQQGNDEWCHTTQMRAILGNLIGGLPSCISYGPSFSTSSVLA
jgi:hypothetical protein